MSGYDDSVQSCRGKALLLGKFNISGNIMKTAWNASLLPWSEMGGKKLFILKQIYSIKQSNIKTDQTNSRYFFVQGNGNLCSFDNCLLWKYHSRTDLTSVRKLRDRSETSSDHCTRGLQSETHSPRLFHPTAWPFQAAHVPRSSVGFGEGLEVAEHWIGQHHDQRQHPDGSNDTVGVGTSLPRPRLQWVADGAVPLSRYGNQAEGGDADGEPYGNAWKAERSIRERLKWQYQQWSDLGSNSTCFIFFLSGVPDVRGLNFWDNSIVSIEQGKFN